MAFGFTDKVPNKKARSGFVYRARWREPGGKERSKSFATKEQAVDHLAGVLKTRRDGTYVDFREAGRWTVSSWWDHWWPIEQLRLRPSTIDRDERLWRLHIEPQLGHVTLERLDEIMIDRWVADMRRGVHRRALGPASSQKVAQLLSRMIEGAIRSRILVVNPAKGVEFGDIESEEMMCLEAGQLQALIEAAGRYRRERPDAPKRGGQVLDVELEEQRAAETARLITVIGWCALRFGEASALQVGDVDLVRRTLTITKTYSEVNGRMHVGPPKTKAGKRKVPISAQVADALTVQCAGKRPDELVFSLPHGGPIRLGKWRSGVFRPVTAAAGVDGVRVHDLRHTGITLWLAAGASPHEVAKWAGHKSSSTVMDRYGHVMPSRAIDVMARLSEMADRPSADVIQIRR